MLLIWTGLIILIFYGIPNLILENEGMITSFYSSIGIILLIYWVFPMEEFNEKPSIFSFLGKPKKANHTPSKLWISIAGAIRIDPNTFDFNAEGSMKNWDLSTLIFLIEIFILIPILIFRLLLFLPIQYHILIYGIGFLKWTINTHKKVVTMIS